MTIDSPRVPRSSTSCLDAGTFYAHLQPHSIHTIQLIVEMFYNCEADVSSSRPNEQSMSAS